MRLHVASVAIFAAFALPPLSGARSLDRVTSQVTEVTSGVIPVTPLPRSGKTVVDGVGQIYESVSVNLPALPDPSALLSDAIGGIGGLVGFMRGLGRDIDKGGDSIAIKPEISGFLSPVKTRYLEYQE